MSAADLTQLESIADQAEAIQPAIEQLASGAGIVGTADTRWGRTAANAYGTFDTAAKKATKELAGLLPEQVAVIRQYVKREREIQAKTKKESEQLAGVIPELPKVADKPSTTGGPNPDGTWTI
ncbi:hypothetical protein [Tsukamurella ocularis]|uniref:hypothetical protein n=1 Tax=Tsukamurella ocularis TaxID=1970234 RepID=UPI0039F05005